MDDFKYNGWFSYDRPHEFILVEILFIMTYVYNLKYLNVSQLLKGLVDFIQFYN